MSAPHPPAPAGVPLLGNGPAFLRDAMGTLWRAQAQLGPVFALRLGPKRMVVVTGPADALDVVNLPESTLSLRPVYRWVIPMFGEVLQAAEYEGYVDQREMMLPALRSRNLPNYLKCMVKEAGDWLGSLGEFGVFDATRGLERLSMSIAVRAFLGEDFLLRSGEYFWRQYVDLAEGMEILLPPRLPLPRLIRRDRARDRLFTLLAPKTAEARLDPDPERHGFLATLVGGRYSDGTPVSDEEVIGLLLSLVFAAYETTAAQLAWSLVLLLQHPDQLKLVVEEADGAPEEPTPGSLHAMRRLHWNLREAERLRPITTMLWRYTEKPYTVGGYTVPAGWFTVLCPPITHRSPEVFDSPGEYDPDRFSPARDPGGRAAATLINLGGGQHRCLGARFAESEMKVVLSMLLRSYRLSLVEPDPPPSKKMGISRPASPCLIAYQRRGPGPGRAGTEVRP
ncbi:cytochrome P450 [Sphaerisporangium sp. TRM90804]|uniref:cytochrome P450 n=1 Tax=Sphaerisporangium sp. TRM90804 TaxID=3031113 RepID=UPI002446D1F4|nr:cytochrome P450 [Sphaerisporangium sp. TRM90804]MDH2429199.1 cytochrome P450 [Sphaerisporangium sp. TRM90804]